MRDRMFAACRTNRPRTFPAGAPASASPGIARHVVTEEQHSGGVRAGLVRLVEREPARHVEQVAQRDRVALVARDRPFLHRRRRVELELARGDQRADQRRRHAFAHRPAEQARVLVEGRRVTLRDDAAILHHDDGARVSMSWQRASSLAGRPRRRARARDDGRDLDGIAFGPGVRTRRGRRHAEYLAPAGRVSWMSESTSKGAGRCRGDSTRCAQREGRRR